VGWQHERHFEQFPDREIKTLKIVVVTGSAEGPAMLDLPVDADPQKRERSPGRPRASSKGPSVTLSSLSRAVGSANPSPLATPNLHPTQSSAPGSGDYFGGSWFGSGNVRPPEGLRSSPMASPFSPSASSTAQIQPGAKNSFASSAFSPYNRLHLPTDGPSQSRLTYVQQPRAPIGRLPDPPNTDPKRIKKKGPSQKVMLSKALQKANDAVILDNDADIEGAVSAYTEACSLLKRVMSRSSVDEDRIKLESIVCSFAWISGFWMLILTSETPTKTGSKNFVAVSTPRQGRGMLTHARIIYRPDSNP